MRKLLINVADEHLGDLEKFAEDRGVSLEAFVESALNTDVVRFLRQLERRWMPHTRWEELARGVDCPICSRLRSDEEVGEEGFKICDLGVTRVDLMRNQFVKGYCVVTSLEHVKEPYDLSKANQRAFFDDILAAGRGIAEAVKSDKLNFEILGNAVPHLHCHIKPRFYGDLAPGIPIDQNARFQFLHPEEYATRIALIRAAIVGLAEG